MQPLRQRALAFPAIAGSALGLALVALFAPPAAALEPTEQEQFMIELVNRARLDPDAEVARFALGDLNEGPPDLGGDPYTIQPGPHQPLAPSPALVDAGEFQAMTLDDNDTFCHTCLGTTVEERMATAGYVDMLSDFDFGGVAFYSGLYGTSDMGFVPGRENLALHLETPSNGVIDDLTGSVAAAHEGLFVDTTVPGRGHRCTMMYGEWREIGVGIHASTDLVPPATIADSLYIAVEFASRSDLGPFLTGVAYRDVDADDFYTPDAGEALGGLTVQAFQAGTQNAVGSTVTFASGGYRIGVPVGSYDVRFSGPGIDQTFPNVEVANGPEGLPENTKVDLVLPAPEPSASALALTASAALAAAAARRSRASRRQGPSAAC